MVKKVDRKFIRRTIADWGKVLLLLLDEAAVVALIVLAFHFFGMQVPLPTMIAIAIIGGIFVLIIHVAVIPSFHRKRVTGREGMVGTQGRVVEPLTPVGTIIVKGEYWKAKSIGDTIDVDKDVEIVGLEGLVLIVKHKR